jgi:uncharacterized Zn finger protein
VGITDDELMEMAGPGAFERGYRYYRDGRVGDFEIRGSQVLSLVSGTDLYRVELRHDDAGLNGSCNCPASDGIAFCKHCVATALGLRDYLAETALGAADSVDDTALKAYLAEQDREVLNSYLLQVLPRDPLLHQRLRRQAMLAANSMEVKELKQSITQVTPLQDIFEWGRVNAYFRRLAASLQGILEIADQLPADILLETAAHGIKRLNKALERIDDSGGYRDHSQAILRELHCRALKRIDWTPGQRAEHLLQMAFADPWDQFEGTPLNYEDALGKAGLDAFYASVEDRLAALPSLPNDATFEDKLPYHRLTGYLRTRAEMRQDRDELIRLEKLTATTEIDFARIARLYLKKGEPEEAAEWLSKADALDRHDRSDRKELWADVHATMGNWEAAVMARESAFRQNLSYDDYQRLMELAEQAGCAKVVHGSVIAFLQSGTEAHSWVDERRAFTLARILRDEQDWSAVQETALGRINDPGRLVEAARWMAKLAPSEAKPIYEKAIDTLICKKSKRSYQEAIRVLLESKSVHDATGAHAYDDCVARLRETHYRKRSLMAALNAAINLG